MKVYNVYKANEELYMTFQSKAEAVDFIEYGAAGVFSEEGFYMTEELVCKCGNDKEVSARYDVYGYATGDWCDECYENGRYPYRKDRYYDYFNAGERLE
jgi:hypothetical protein